MRATAWRNWAAGLATAALVAGLTACTSGGDDKTGDSGSAEPEVKGCANGTFVWTGVKETDKLTIVSQQEQLDDAGGMLQSKLTRVYVPRRSVESATGPSVSAAEVLFSLGKEIGEIDTDARTLAEDVDSYAFTDLNAKDSGLGNTTSEMYGAGAFVRYAAVREVEGDFSYACPGGKTATGHAWSWRSELDGILDCHQTIEGQVTGDDRLARQAARHSCVEGDPATKGAA
ncbi:hypothetical protein [Streptomyces sp. NPDC018693]|uniref:hypothetical protein n=1 Tax=unclassified Streptomyces TaxID=2593676 RepID=UPI003798BAC6